jgi:hypothetical protein
MIDAEPFDSDSDSDSIGTYKSLSLGLIGAMKDGMVDSFSYRGLRVNRSGDSMWVTEDNEAAMNDEPLGGHLYLPSATVRTAFEWLETKADYYEVAE